MSEAACRRAARAVTAALFLPLSALAAHADEITRKTPRPDASDPNWASYSEEVKNEKLQAWAQARMRLQLGADFIIEREAPYVIGANCSRERLEKIRSEILVKFTRAVTKQFKIQPRHEMRVFLFKKDSDDLAKYARKLWNEDPPPGASAYALPEKYALMVPDGGGMGMMTVRHEIMHLLVRYAVSNPAIWFDEGFATYLESARVAPSGDKIQGGHMWLLDVAQGAVRRGDFSLSRVLRLDRYEGTPPLEVYALGAMVFLYLEEKGKVEEFFSAYRGTWKQDRTGRSALEKVAGQRLEDFEKAWKPWVLARRNPPPRAGGEDAPPKTPGGDPAPEPPAKPPEGEATKTPARKARTEADDPGKSDVKN